MACDEKVLSKCNDEQKKEYALALIGCAESKSAFVSAFGGAKIRKRINNILSYKKLTWISCVGFGALIAVIAYVLLTNAR
jgi:beta-lactamase regulating signal transducer with metallopeptidase domain